MIQEGQKYRHYKGNEYIILAIAKHTETLEEMVVYQDLSDASKIWVRPMVMFSGALPDGQQRFERLKESDGNKVS